MSIRKNVHKRPVVDLLLNKHNNLYDKKKVNKLKLIQSQRQHQSSFKHNTIQQQISLKQQIITSMRNKNLQKKSSIYKPLVSNIKLFTQPSQYSKQKSNFLVQSKSKQTQIHINQKPTLTQLSKKFGNVKNENKDYYYGKDSECYIIMKPDLIATNRYRKLKFANINKRYSQYYSEKFIMAIDQDDKNTDNFNILNIKKQNKNKSNEQRSERQINKQPIKSQKNCIKKDRSISQSIFPMKYCNKHSKILPKIIKIKTLNNSNQHSVRQSIHIDQYNTQANMATNSITINTNIDKCQDNGYRKCGEQQKNRRLKTINLGYFDKQYQRNKLLYTFGSLKK